MNKIIEILEENIHDLSCPLNYNKDYELLIAVMLSAQTTDEIVNKVTKVLFSKYDIYSLVNANINDIIEIVKPCGFGKKKSENVINIAKRLVNDFNGVVPNNREYLESLPGIGRKCANVILSSFFDEQVLAVDTHVSRVAKRLKLANIDDDVLIVEQKLINEFPNYNLKKLHLLFLKFGRNICKSKNPQCNICPLKEICQKNANLSLQKNKKNL